MKKTEKPFFVANLTEQLKSASCVLMVDYSGLSVKMQQELKKSLREAEAEMLIVKNTLFKRAGMDAKIPKDTLEDTVLKGPTAIIISESDPISPLQALYKFAKENDIPQLKVGIIEGKFQDRDSLEKLAKLPSKAGLHAQVVGSISSPIYGLVGTLQGNLQKLVFILDEYSKSEAQPV